MYLSVQVLIGAISLHSDFSLEVCAHNLPHGMQSVHLI